MKLMIILTFLDMNGKIKFVKVSVSQLEGVLYWPSNPHCTENDHQCVLDLFIVWRFVNANQNNSPDSLQTRQTISGNLDNVISNWLKIENFCTDDKICKYSVWLLEEIINKIWNSGFNVTVIRSYYPVITRAARNIEEVDGLGFMKLIYSQLIIIPTALEIDGIIRKRPITYFAIHIHILSRKLATVNMIKDFIEVKDQVEEKERINFFFNFFDFIIKI